MSSTAPLILIGTMRSGTTWMGDVLSMHPGVAYWSEPRHVWSWGHAYRQHYRLDAEDATPRIIRHIRSVFHRYEARHEGRRIIEKTPSNCLRVPFIEAIFPDARYVLILRDGRAVIRSGRERAERGIPVRRIVARTMQTPMWEWPASAPRAFSALESKLLGRSLSYWGPRPPGWCEWVRQGPRVVALAKIWAATIDTAVNDLHRIDTSRVMTLRYETLICSPKAAFERLLDFAGLSRSDDMLAHAAQTVDPSRAEKWKQEFDAETLDLIRPHIEPTLATLGYEW